MPAQNPEHVANVLAELMGGYAGPFIGPIPGAWAAYANDEHGTGIEVYPERTMLVPGPGDTQGTVELGAPAMRSALHILLSVKVDRATIEKIGAREGWRCIHFWRGPSPEVKLFELYELWIENRILVEAATPDMLPAYVKIANGPAQRAFFDRAAARR